ncbi:hypothetical protein [Sphingomonas jeddahensis]|uniref:Uncharacterized protein n=1 Tax=Sphingomonas jeddahensis TaxID=1915074 RepID=A0A1V2ETD3_9SPHN|nr:hypothetical protein [Sphingomonas jeddahensis]ONF95404.1 hypothetical protein SPHI_23010 [Sphingomonas jeddahensis]
MAYIAFDTIDGGPSSAFPSAPAAPALIETAEDIDKAAGSRLGALEWAVVALARRDTLSSLRAPGRMSTALRAILRQNNPRLADERLEALRRMAVLAWHHSFQVPTSELRAFFGAGFTVGQYEAMMASIVATRAKEPPRR